MTTSLRALIRSCPASSEKIDDVSMSALELASTPTRPRARLDAIACRILGISDSAQRVTSAQAQRAFSLAMVISGLRCLLSYIVLPVLLPVFGAATGVKPWIGAPVAALAIVFDVRGIRRVWLANSRHRWAMTGLYVAVMALVTFLMVHDLISLAS